MGNVKVELTGDHADEGVAGDVVEVHPDRAAALIGGGVARPATVKDAKAAGAPPETAATKGKGSS